MSAESSIRLEHLSIGRRSTESSYDLSGTATLRSADNAQRHYSSDQSRSAREPGANDRGSREEDPESIVNYIDALPPVDTGRHAWSFLVAATVLETLIWGIPYTVGVFHEYWTSTLFKGQGEGVITLASTLQTGLMYMSTAAFGP